jgi:hypothetical protein
MELVESDLEGQRQIIPGRVRDRRVNNADSRAEKARTGAVALPRGGSRVARLQRSRRIGCDGFGDGCRRGPRAVGADGMSDVSCQSCILGGIRYYCKGDKELAGTMFPSKGGRIKFVGRG